MKERIFFRDNFMYYLVRFDKPDEGAILAVGIKEPQEIYLGYCYMNRYIDPAVNLYSHGLHIYRNAQRVFESIEKTGLMPQDCYSGNMAKDTPDINGIKKFVQLREKGYTYKRISQLMKKHERTLSRWTMYLRTGKVDEKELMLHK